jgi:hypothetical protein
MKAENEQTQALLEKLQAGTKPFFTGFSGKK